MTAADHPATRPVTRRSLGFPARVWLLRTALVVGLVVLLEIYGRAIADPAFFRPPSAVVAALFSRVLAEPRILAALGTAVFEIAAAYALSAVAGFFVGLLIGSTRLARESLFPIVLLLYAIPQVSLIPLVILLFGLGPAAKIAFGFSHGIFPVIVNVVAGMRGVKPLYLRGAQAMGASRADIVRHVLLPNMVPSLFVGLRLAMTLTMLGVILAELYVSTGGVGYFTRTFSENYDPAPLFALIGALAIVAIVFNELVRLAEHRLTPGSHSGRPFTVPSEVP